VPLLVLVFITLLKDCYNTYFSLKNDSSINNTLYKYWNGFVFSEIQSKNLITGHLVKLQENEKAPADLILLLSGSEESSIFVDSSQTTGENNLITKKILTEIQMFCNSSEIEVILKKIVGTLKFEQPNSDFNSFNGKMHIERYPKTIELTADNLLYRGSSFYGTSWVVGLVVYTGLETKTYLNLQRPKKKLSRMERTVNRWVVYILGVLLLFVIFSSVTSMFLSSWNSQSFIENFIVFTVLYNNIVPISLIVVIDIVKVLQVFLTNHKHRPEITFNSSDINENIGQVEYILADKSGTVSSNKLKLHSIMVDFCVYEKETALDRVLTEMDEDPHISQGEKFNNSMMGLKLAFCKSRENPIFSHFLQCLVICNTVTPVNGKFLGVSPDEIALVEAAQELGIQLLSRNSNSCKVDWEGENVCFEVLAEHGFSKENKISRVLIKDKNLKAFYYIKASLELLEDSLDISNEDRGLLIDTLNHLKNKGLRTMVLAYREIMKDELVQFEIKLESARSFPVNSELRVNELFPLIENGMTLLGATGIEDVVLQETQDSVEVLKEAGIKVWLLSEDGETNTLLTAHKSRIFSPESNVFRINKLKNQHHCLKMLKRAMDHLIFHSDDESISNVIRYLTRKSTILKTDENFRDYNNASAENRSELNVSEEGLSHNPLFSKISNMDSEVSKMLERKFLPENLNYTLSIDSQSLRTALENSESRKVLVCLLVCAEAVAFHSLLPHDKAAVARLLKENVEFRPVTLAVGDADADIPMMQAVDVAVNVKCSSSQARNYCDVSVSRFSLLRELVLDVGHWNYVRLAKVILLFLYKNFLITFVTFGYFVVADYSPISIISDSLLIGFNLFTTTLPIICLGIFDFTYYSSDKKLQRYGKGLQGQMFDYKKLLEFSLLSIIHALLIISFSIGFGQLRIVNELGMTEDFELLGTFIYIEVVLVVLAEITIRTLNYTCLYITSHFLSISFLIIHLVVISSLSTFDVYLVGNELKSSSTIIYMTLTLPLIIPCSIWLISASIKLLLPHSSKFSRLSKYSKNLNKVYRSTHGLSFKTTRDVYEFYKYSLEFCSEYVEKIYKQIFINQNIRLLRLTIIILWFLLILWTIIELVLYSTSVAYIIIRVLLCAGFTTIMALSSTSHFMKYYESYVIVVILLTLFLKFGTDLAFKRVGSMSTAVIPSITYILFNVNWVKISVLNTLNQMLFLISVIYAFDATTSMSPDSVLLMIGFIIFNFSIALTSAIVGHNLEKNNRLEYKLIKTKELGIEKTQRILSFLLPSFVKKRVKNGARYIADDQGVVTVLFCDIVDFESIVAEYTPQEMTSFLDSVFQKFDSICSAHGVTKIETVGKTYLACAGIRDSEDEIDSDLKSIPHPQRVVSLALSMIHEVSKFKLKNRKFLKIKIGINTGPVTAGVVGHHKPQFSLVGDTVNTASRMCSTLEAFNKIQISKATFELLGDFKGLYFTSSVIEAKGKGKMHTYVVNEGSRSTNEEAWLDFSHISSIPHHVSSAYTMEKDTLGRNESMKKMKKSIMSSITQKDINDYEKTGGLKRMKLFDFSCKENPQLKEFRRNLMTQNKNMMALGLGIACGNYMILMIFVVVYYSKYHLDLSILIVSLLGVALMWLTFALFNKLHQSGIYQVLFVVILSLMTIQALLFQFSQAFIEDFDAIQIMYISLILDHVSGVSPIRLFWLNFAIFAIWVTFSVIYSSTYGYVANVVIVLGFMVINLSTVFKRESQLRSYFNLKKLAGDEIEKTEKLLTQMMPPHVLENMKKGKSVTDRFSNVTLLYADIVGFTYWSSDKNPEQVVGMLSELFTLFDKLCVEHKVYKVHTIGDCYVVMGLMDVRKRDFAQECLNVINMGLSMIKVIHDINDKKFSQLNMRIGVHTGDVIGGVIGTNIVRYDIYGPDVLIANKMESGGEPGKINVSDATKNLLESGFSGCFGYTFNKVVEAKALKKGIKSYFLSPKHF
jgi:phospholipid-translocating P-type ATPase (flippase)